MKTPSYETTAIIGGTNQSTKVDALPPVINVRQSGRLRIICLDENSFEYDITSLTGTDCKAKPYGTNEVEVTLGTGTVKYTPEIFTLTSPATPPTLGNFTLTVAGETTGVINYNATASDVLSALEALPSRSAGDFEVQQTAGLNLSEAGASVRITLSGGFQLTARSTYTTGTIDNDIVLATVRTQSTLQNMYEVIWVKDKIPAGWATFPEALGTGSGSIVIWVELEETGTEDFYSISERFNIEAGDFSQSGDITPEVNLIWYYNPTFEYDNVTADADPTTGKFRTNNTTLASATEIYISDTNKSNTDLSSYFQSLLTGSRLYFGNPNVVLESAFFEVSGTPVNNTNYTTIPVTFVSAGTPAFTTGSFFSVTIDAQSGSIQNNYSATTDPTATDDSSAGYAIGSKWVNITTDEAYICLDATATSAVWTNTTLDVSELATVAVSGDSDDLTEGATNLLLTPAERTKVGHLTVTQAVDLDTMESDISTNNSKVSNATHTGEVTGSGGLTLDSTAISNKTAVTADGADYFLIGDTSDSDNLKKALVSDVLGVVGPASSTDNAIARFDSTTAKLIQNSSVTVDDNGKIDTGTEVAIGTSAGTTSQGSYSIAVGYFAGNSSQDSNAIAIGRESGGTTQSADAIALGYFAGNSSQGSNAIAIGRESGGTTQSADAIAVGYFAGNSSQGSNAIAIGRQSGGTTQGNNSVAIGREAGKTTQGSQSVAIGYFCGRTTQGNEAVAIGREAGNSSQGANTVAIGREAGKSSQGSQAIAIGRQAGETSQTSNTIAIGYQAGQTSLGSFCTAIGYRALTATTGSNNTAVGYDAGRLITTGTQNTALGSLALDANLTGLENTAIGYACLGSSTGSSNTAIGSLSLLSISTGTSNVALGRQSGRYISGGVTANQTSGTSCYIGADTKAGADGNSNEIVIGYNATGNGSNTVTLGNTSITETHIQGALAIDDGITAPSTITGKASIYVDSSDGDLKIKFSDGTVKTIVVDT